MEKVQVKQVEGAVDDFSGQNIDGEKTFLTSTNFKSKNAASGVVIRIEDGFIYWTKNPFVLNAEGNMRLGKHPTTGAPSVQLYKGGAWTDQTF
jgi:hypothetical protein